MNRNESSNVIYKTLESLTKVLFNDFLNYFKEC